jgi:hypothetical protein
VGVDVDIVAANHYFGSRDSAAYLGVKDEGGEIG